MGGFAAARGRYVIMGDADGSYDFGHIEAFVERLRAGDDLVMGNRFRGGIEDGAMPFLHRYLGNPVLSFVGRLLFPSAIGDFHCGLRGFRRDVLAEPRPAQPGDGVRQRDGGQGDARRAEDLRGADDALPRPALAPAAPAHLARRLAPPALPAPLQPALALLLSRPGADGRRPGRDDRAAARRTAPLRDRLRRPHPGLCERDDRRRLPGDPLRGLRPHLRDDHRLPARQSLARRANERISLEAGRWSASG